jgi:GIY-YIG catalytic domain
MKYVYLIQSEQKSDEQYVGVTSDLKARIKAHNDWRSSHIPEIYPFSLEFRSLKKCNFIFLPPCGTLLT